jgi:F-type H+-transporting ATPase subunit gamma
VASTRDIRRRIKSVKNTRQITKAMELVAASKMKKAQQAALAGRPYAELMAACSRPRRSRRGGAAPVPRPSVRCSTRGIILITSDKGLWRSAQREPLQARHRYQNARPNTR